MGLGRVVRVGVARGAGADEVQLALLLVGQEATANGRRNPEPAHRTWVLGRHLCVRTEADVWRRVKGAAEDEVSSHNPRHSEVKDEEACVHELVARGPRVGRSLFAGCGR